MDLFMRGVALAATEDDVKIALAKILHKAPFRLQPALNFDVILFKKYNKRGQMGILTFPEEVAGRCFLQRHGAIGVTVKGSQILFTESNRPLDEGKIAILNSTQWRDPRQLREEREGRIREGRPFPLESYAFGRFLRDGTFSSEFYADGSADIACDLERHSIRFTLRSQGHRSGVNEDDDLVLPMLHLGADPPTTIVTYPPKTINEIRENNRNPAEGPTLFIRANAFPLFAIERCSILLQRTDVQRSQGLIPDVPMPPGSFCLKCTFVNELDMAAFTHCAQAKLHVRVLRHAAIRVRNNTSANHHASPVLGFLKDLPFELAFEVEKAITNWTLSDFDAWRLAEELERLCETYNDAAAPIFRQFISLLEDGGPTRERQSRRRARRQRDAPTTLEGRLAQAVELYLETQSSPRGRLATALPSAAVSYSYHMVLTPTRHILEGPVADQSNSVLRRFGRNDCFLRVSFHDENRSKLRRDLDTSIAELLTKRYRPVLLNGCVVAGRRYDMLGYSMSGLKEHSLWFVTEFQDDKGKLWNAKTIRDSLGDFSPLLYQPARLGARWSQAFSATDPSITLETDEIRYISDIKSRKNKDMTDGCSPISTELARAIWRANQRTKKRPVQSKVPSAFQFRLGGAKGMVVQDPTLEGRVVCLRPSQVKFEAPENRTFDIQSTSLRPKLMFLNRPLIVLLEYLGSSAERIIELQDRSINEAQSIQTSFANASKALQQHGMGSSFHLPSLLKNMSTILNLKMHGRGGSEDAMVYNDLIANSLHCAETHILRELKYRAHIAVPGSFTVLGVSDEWDCLREGEIFATIEDEKTGLYQEITGRVAITRSPQIHPGDVQVVTAVRRKELAHLRNVVVFSCRGDRSLSSCLGGGDLDGDDFNLILDPKLIPEANVTPGDYISLPIKQTTHPCDVQDVVEFIFNFIEADLVGHIAISHLRFSDKSDPSCDDCLKLAELASQAVDFPKTGTPVQFHDLPRHRGRTKPDFLAREGADLRSENYYPSQKLLGQLFRRVPVKDWMPQEWNDTRTPSGGDEIEHALRQVNLYALGLNLAAPSDELSEEMDYLLDDYCNQLLAIATAYTISKNKDIYVSESELVSGTIMANWPDHHRRREAVGAMNLQTHELVRAVRSEMRASNTAAHGEDDDDDFFEDWDDETATESDFYRETRQIAEMFRRAWAGWCAAESALMRSPGSYGPQSFGLIALGRMLELIKAAQRQV